MIFKLNVNDGWIIIDDIYNVEIRENCFRSEEVPSTQSDFKTTIGAKFSVDMVIEDCSKLSLAIKDNRFTIISLFRHKNDPLTYAFNTTGYLTNDNGKTLEVLNNR